MKNIPTLLFTLTLLCISTTAVSQKYDWKFKKEVQGLKIYVRNVEGSNLKQLKFTTLLEASLHSVVSLLQDVEAYQRWVYKCQESKNVARVGNFETYDYYHMDFPWPMTDRDLYCRSTLTQDPETLVVISHTIGVPQYGPETKDVIRVIVQENQWTLNPLSPDKVHLTYFLRAEPAGNIPDWLVNLAIDQGPIKSMKKFKRLLQEEKYQKAVVDGIINFR